MKDSLFNRLYRYRQREAKNERENFLIELFAFALEAEPAFLMRFLQELEVGFTEVDKVAIEAQKRYKDGRPDIEVIVKGKVIILIECKVDAGEGESQLPRYCKILTGKKEYKRKILVFLTKHYEHRESFSTLGVNISFHLLRWYQISQWLSEISSNNLIEEFKNYLTEEGMTQVTQFQPADLLALTQLSGLMAKMDEVLDRVKAKLPDNLKDLRSESSRLTKVRSDGCYVETFKVNPFPKEDPHVDCTLQVGFFFQGRGDELPSVGVMLWQKTDNQKKREEKLNGLCEKLSRENDSSNWQTREGNDPAYQAVVNVKPLSQFMSGSGKDLDEVEAYLVEALGQISEKIPQVD